MCDEADVVLEFLSPDSPDYYPVEIIFSVLKAWIKKYIEQAQDLEDFEDFGHFLVCAVEKSGADIHLVFTLHTL